MKRDDKIRTVKDLQEVFPDVPIFVVPNLHEHQLPKRPVEAIVKSREAQLHAIRQSRNNKSKE